MDGKLSIDFIGDQKQWIETVALWHHKESFKGKTPIDEVEQARHLQKRVAILEKHAQNRSIPTTFLASIDGRPVGTTSVVHYQFTPKQARSEWLTNIFIVSEFRKRGVAKKLIDHATEFAINNGVSNLSLYTKDKGHFYHRLGWDFAGRAQIQHEQVEIYRKNIE